MIRYALALSVALMIFPGSAQAEDVLLLLGKWQAISIKNTPVLEHHPAKMEFTERSTVMGTGGCNHFRGQVAYVSDHLSFGPMALTKKRCEQEVMLQEQKLLSVLPLVGTYTVVDGVLTLHDSEGVPMIHARRAD